MKELKNWDKVTCSNTSEEKAIEYYKNNKDDFYYYIWINRDWEYIVEEKIWCIEWFKYCVKLENIKIENNPRWKVGDYVVFENAVEDYIEYIKIFSVIKNTDWFEYNNISEIELRNPTDLELKYFR